MNRSEFMGRLYSLLSGISSAEREEAMKYYNDYFDDAGADREGIVIIELGSPEKVASNIMLGLGGRDESAGEYSETGYRAGRKRQENEIVKRQNDSGAGKVILIILILILLSPFLAGAAGCVIGLAAALFGICISVLAVAVGFTLIGIVLAAIGIYFLFVNPLHGLALMGAGLILAGLGLLSYLLFHVMVFYMAPAIIKGISYVFHKVFPKKEEVT